MTGLRLPTRGITFALDTDGASLPCIECGTDVDATFEVDPDDDCAGVTVTDQVCGECGEAWCDACSRVSEESMCAACTAELGLEEQPRENVRAAMVPLGYEPEKEA